MAVCGQMILFGYYGNVMQLAGGILPHAHLTMLAWTA